MKRFSMIKAEVKKKALIKGIILSFLGMILLIGMGVFATTQTLSTWGIPSFFCAIFLIGLGLIPYRKLTRLETHPHQLIFEKESLTFISTHGNQITTSYQNIDKISYTETISRYGIRLELKEGNPLFFPYFSNDPSLNEIVHPNQPDETV